MATGADVKGEQSETAAFLGALADSLKARAGTDGDLAEIVSNYLLVEEQPPDAVEKALQAMNSLAGLRAAASSEARDE